ncbi:autotransporter domain-containing protein [Mesorhizobium sp. CGMCC 1.15528]|uniref:Autotransporter domain-containing protein n=1 Tax=Mesorhizobium zhangyense TaxID=1776730 RepID=A0A7C9V7E5_9HYPH|nr:autotransporter-associated beta strand repeat-containing protein [Mesorhizobium zhangyense]NGN41683.1 autotransporter domain-containing protein [Mesorhizobium zhangyense]
MAVSIQPAWADGGAGSAGSFYGGRGGVDSAEGTGENGVAASYAGGGGGAGKTGGNGATSSSGGNSIGGNGGASAGEAGADGGSSSNASGGGGGGGAHGSVDTALPGTTTTGGKGGKGGDGNYGDGGGGGAGGYGAVVIGDGDKGLLSTNLEGGAGGAGGATSLPREIDYGGNGGSGGVGLLFSGTGGKTVTIGAGVTGGNGGNAGAAHVNVPYQYRSKGGAGGAGLVGDNLAITIDASGAITGGNGGAPSATGFDFAGAGGVGLSGSGLTVSLSGAISGGFSGDGTSRANAIDFTGGNNFLTLNTGWSLNGGIGVTGGLTFDQAISATVANTISGSGTLTKTGAGTLTLTGANTYSGTTTITAGVLQVGNGGTTGQLGSGAVVNNSALVYNRSGTFTVANTISGSGTLTRTGSGTQILTGANTYSGTTTITAGILQVGNGGTTGQLGSGAIVNNSALVYNRSDDFTVANTISGTGTFTKEGEGTLTLTGANTYSGGTTVSEGTLALGRLNAAGTGGLTVNGGTFDLGNYSQVVSSLQGTGGTINSNGGMLNVDQTTDTAFDGDVTGLGTLNKNGTGTLTMNGVIRGGHLGISAGTLVLNSANTYNVGGAGGGTFLADATLIVGHDNALADSTLSVFGSNAILGANKTVTLANDIDLVGISNGSLTVDTTADLTLSGIIRDNGGTSGTLTKKGEGALSLTGANTYGGGTTVSDGTLAISDDANLGAATGRLKLDGGTLESLADIEMTRAISLGTSGGSFAPVSGTSLTLGGDIDGDGGLDIEGDGTLVLTGTNSYLGGTAVSGGTLVLGTEAGGAGSLTTTILGEIVNDGGILEIVKADLTDVTMIRNKSFTVFHNNMSAGSTSITNTGLLAFDDTSSAGEADIINDGGVVFADMTSAGMATITNNGVLIFYGESSADNATITATEDAYVYFTDYSTAGKAALVANGSVFDLSNTLGTDGDGLVTAGSIAGTSTGTFFLGENRLVVGGNGASTEFAGEIADDDPSCGCGRTGGSLVKTGTGTLTLTGASTYTGGTTVSNGTLRIGDGGAGGSIAGDVDVSGSGTVSGTGSIAGDVRFSAGGVLAGAQGQTLTIGGDLALDAASSIDVALGGAPTAALFDVHGDLTLDGTLNITDQGGFGAGVYRLFDYGGALTDNGLDIGMVPTGVDAATMFVQTAAAQQVNLVNTAGQQLRFWDGGDPAGINDGIINGGDGVWSAEGATWTGDDGALNGPMLPDPAFAVFQGVAGTVTVDDGSGTVAATGMQFVTDGYRIEGDGIALAGIGGESIIRVGDGTAAGAATTATIASSLTGTARLIKDDLGTLVLEGANTYAGGTELRGGTLSVASDANLGNVAGGLAFTGGTLATISSFDSARAVALDTTGRFDVAAATQLGLGGAITGAGDLYKTGAGTLVLTGANAYGNTLVAQGTLAGNTASISGNIGNAAIVVFDQGADNTFAGTIAGLGGTNGAMIKRGAGTLTLAGASSLDWSVETGGLVSSASRFGGDAAIGIGARFTLDDAANATYAGVISGAGDFIKAGAGDLRLTGDSSAFEGLTTVSGGRLSVGVGGFGSLGGTLVVASGGFLGGSGTIGTTSVASGGIIAPGNSIGTLKVNGDLTLAAGSIYRVEIAGTGTSDRIDVTGKATVSGSNVSVMALDPKVSYQNGQTYRILNADGGVSGTFAAPLTQSAFLDLTLDHKAKSVDLTIKIKGPDPEEPEEPEEPETPPLFGTVAETRNQLATAGALDTLEQSGASLALYNTLLVLDAAQARAAFDGLSGEVHASAKTALIEDTAHIRNAANDRIRAAFEGVGAAPVPILAYGPDGQHLAPASSDHGLAVWGNAFGSWGHVGSDGNAARLDHSTGGLLVGGDAMLGDWRLGLLAGYSRSSFDVKGRASSGDSDNYHVGLYGGTQWGALAFRTGLAYSWHDIETRRDVAFPGFSDQLKGDYRAGTTQLFGEFGYGIEAGAFSFEPFANLAYVSLRTGGFAEQGGAAALASASQTTDVTFTTLGLRAASAFTLGTVEVTAKGMLGWRHAFGDVTPLSTAAFAGSNAFTVAGTPIARNAALVEAGLDLKLSDTASISASYTGQYGSGAQEHGFKARLGVAF